MNPALWLLALAALLAGAAHFFEARPTRRAVVWIVALAVSSAAAALWAPAWIVTAAADGVLIAAAVYDLRSLPRRGDFRVERRIPRTISQGRRHQVRLTIEFEGDRPLQVQVRDGVPRELGAEGD